MSKIKETIFFLHAFPFSKEMWKAQLDGLPKDYRGIAVDLRGFGKASLCVGTTSIEGMVEDLISKMNHLKMKKVILCGLSMGGYVALRTVEKYPQRVSALILADTKSTPDGNEAKIKRSESIQLILKKGLKSYVDVFLKGVLSEKNLKNKLLVSSLKKMILQNSKEGICAALMGLAARTDTTSSLSHIQVPTLILVGDEDRLTPLSDAQTMKKKIKKAQLKVIPAGHLSHLENPEAFNRCLVDFLNSI
ncbi:MAG: alpha/beta fold hydrolase [Deltaproteobacteria bacterium]|nr:alpha/beta fold hydrolase [Deltaproteobacteria bacterium]